LPTDAAWRAAWPWVAAVVAGLALAWPPDRGRSVAFTAINWIADPARALPRRPSPLAMGVDDDADVVTAHDVEEQAYESLYRRSWFGRVRLRMRDAEDPLEPATERPLLVAAAAIVVMWVTARSRTSPPRPSP